MRIPSTINIRVDVAYAFDYLAILEIKKDMNILKNDIYIDFISNLEPSIDNNTLQSILNSIEYKELKEANLETFNAVEMAKNNTIKASYVNECNYKRFLKKQSLQNKFCENQMTIEVKN
jgi:hypothetical protein